MGYKTYTCPHAASCGACEWLSVPYERQLERKQQALKELFEPLGAEVEPVLGMEEPLAYRAKVMTPFVRAERGRPTFGMYRKGTHEVIEARECLVEAPQARPILRTIAELAWKYHIKPYDEDTGRGLLRHAIVRCAHASEEVMVTLVINRREFPHKREFVRDLRAAHPAIATVVFNVNTRNTNAVLGPHSSTAYGQGWLEDRLCGCSFRIPSSAFYQTNPAQTEVLYRTAVELARLRGGERVLDAYCGIGTIGIVAAREARRNALAKPLHKKKAARAAARGKKPKATLAPEQQVELVGVEDVPAAIEAARENARLNHVNGTTFVQADAGRFLKEVAQPFDVVFMDPPRSGASEEFIEGLRAAAPKRIVYISCNPATQVRDIRALGSAYRIQRVVPVDMFPHTKHVECVVLMSRKDA